MVGSPRVRWETLSRRGEDKPAQESDGSIKFHAMPIHVPASILSGFQLICPRYLDTELAWASIIYVKMALAIRLPTTANAAEHYPNCAILSAAHQSNLQNFKPFVN
jgi:hypothetical protein